MIVYVKKENLQKKMKDKKVTSIAIANESRLSFLYVQNMLNGKKPISVKAREALFTLLDLRENDFYEFFKTKKAEI